MLNFLLNGFVKFCLALRYRIRVKGLDNIAAKGTGGILFLPNHPALIDPIIMQSILQPVFRVRALADREQIDRFFVRWLAKRVNVIPILDPAKFSDENRQVIQAGLDECVKALRAGQNVLLYPAGHIYTTRHEHLRGNSGVEILLQQVPRARVVLVRQTGLWGSAFSRACGFMPSVAQVLEKGLPQLLASGLLYAPKRDVEVEFFEPADLPRDADRNSLNAYLENFYNAKAPPNTYVPRTIWEGGKPVAVPEPAARQLSGDSSEVPQATRQIVLDYLRQLTDRTDIADRMNLAADLGLDSLDRGDLLIWLEKEFGHPQIDAESLTTVGDVMLAACGSAVATAVPLLKPAPRKWFAGADSGSRRRVAVAPGSTIAECFLAQATQSPGRVAVADQLRGAMTYRDLITAIIVLRPLIEKLPGERLGIMLPASCAATTIYLAAMFAGKTPVMVNWTVGQRNLQHCLDHANCRSVITAGAMVRRLAGQGMELSGMKDRFIELETLAGGISAWTKLRAAASARLSWASPRSASISPTAAILFTSGSETFPKAVPLSHANILANVRDVLGTVPIYRSDRMMGILPPFHSFGLTVTMCATLTAGLPVVYHANPTESAVIARLIQAYRATLMIGTPTFLSSIVQASLPGQLASLRLAVTGAERCPEKVYQALEQACPQAVILEGYGITECSPIVTVNDPAAPRHGTIGKALPSFELAVVDEDSGRPAPSGSAGMLLVRGSCVFDGYLNYDGPSPFVEYAGKKWYRTGDLVIDGGDGVLTFKGRLKRFVKLGGEMVSLPAIEAVLEKHYASEGDEGPVLAVESSADDDKPEITLFTTVAELDRTAANANIRAAGLSALHNIRRIVVLEKIPTLGTGKTDYRQLKQMLAED